MTDQEQGEQHEHEQDGSYGMALGFHIVEDQGHMYLAEAEIAPYVDEPNELGVTLVFHPLDEMNPADASEDVDWPAWPIDIDDDLTRDPGAPVPEQFQAIVRQLHGMAEGQLRNYLDQARQDAGE